MALYRVGDIVTNQDYHLRVILKVVPEDKKRTEHYEVMELSPLQSSSYFISWPQGKISEHPIYEFDKLHYLFKVKHL